MGIKENVKKILSEIPDGVVLEAAAKTRTAEEISEAIEAGIKIIGENYIQEARNVFEVIGKKAEWHYIGHLQKNKVKKAVGIFDMIETVHSPEIASRIDRYCEKVNKIMSVLIEVNSGREPQKFGVFPEDAETLIQKILPLSHIKIMGLMTMGPRFGNPDDARPYFKETYKLFNNLKAKNIPNTEIKYLSMGMSNTYKIAIDEGANIIRIGTKIFGEREE